MYNDSERKTSGNQKNAQKSEIETDVEIGKAEIRIYENHGVAIKVEQYAVDILGSEDDNICEDKEYEVVYEIESGKIEMENQPFFSIVMPVYGVEEYLEKAVYSVLGQSFQNFEVILVDDKSPDNAGKICDELAIKNANIIVIHHDEQRGLSMARNTGDE